MYTRYLIPEKKKNEQKKNNNNNSVIIEEERKKKGKIQDLTRSSIACFLLIFH